MTEKQKESLRQKPGIRVIESKQKPKETIAEICGKMTTVAKASMSEMLDR